MHSVAMMVGHIQPLAGGLLTTTGEMTSPVRFEYPGGRDFEIRLGVQFESLKRPAAMPQAMAYAIRRFKDRMGAWMTHANFSADAYDAFAGELVAELDACFGPLYGVVFRGLALYGLETLPMLVGASGLWKAPARAANPGWWWE